MFHKILILYSYKKDWRASLYTDMEWAPMYCCLIKTVRFKAQYATICVKREDWTICTFAWTSINDRSPNKVPVKAICHGDDKSLIKITQHEIATIREKTINGNLCIWIVFQVS